MRENAEKAQLKGNCELFITSQAVDQITHQSLRSHSGAHKGAIDRVVIVTNIIITDKYLNSNNAHLTFIVYLLFIYVI